MRRLTETVLILAALALPSGAFYTSPPAGGFPGEVLASFTASPRALALGDAYTSAAEEAAGMYYNPASASLLGHQSISVFYTHLPLQGRYASVFYSYPLFMGTSIGAGIIDLTSGEAEKRNVWGGYEGVFRDEERVILLNLNRALAASFYCGLNFKFISKKISDYGDSGFGIDAGLIYAPSDRLTAGLRLQNLLSPGIKLHRVTERHPFNIRAGVSALMLDRRLTGLLDIEIIDAAGEHTLARWHAGLEYAVMSIFRLRAGANYKGVSGGVGLLTDRFSYSYTLRYSEMGIFHAAGISVSFGYLPDARERELARREELLGQREELFDNWKNEEQRRFLSRFDRARRQVDEELETARTKNRELEALIQAALDINRGDYARAETALKRILRDDPENRDANVLLGIIQEDLREHFSFNRMMAAYESGEFERAMNEASRAGEDHLQYEQAQVIGHLSAARYYVMEGDYDTAEKALLKLLENRPGDQHAVSLLQRIKRLRELQRND